MRDLDLRVLRCESVSPANKNADLGAQMRPEVKMARVEPSVLAARHHTMLENIGIQFGAMGLELHLR